VKKPVDVGDGHYRILSLDGGGLRAIIETVILSRLIEVFPDLLQRVDLIGTHAPFGLDYAVRNSS
jgi:patatin-like phospholipase/acyl hydrolase